MTALPRTIVGCLIALGCPKLEVTPKNAPNRYKASFWKRNEDRLDEWLARAHAAHRKLIVRYHPDRPGGNAKKAEQINALWTRTEKLFRQKISN